MTTLISPVSCFCLNENGLFEKGVTWQDDQFTWQLQAPSSHLTSLVTSLHLHPPYQSEINLALETFISSIVTRMQQGVILFADYGYGQREYYHPARNTGTLTCFYQHRKNHNPFLYPGLQDITAHVDFTRVIEIAATHGAMLGGFTNQASFLMNSGLSQVVMEQEQSYSAAAKVNFHHAIKKLTMPTEMGESVKVMGLTKNYDHPLLGFSALDRSRDL